MSLPTTAKEMILGMPSRFKADSAADETGRFHFELEGETGGNFTITDRKSVV